MMMILLKVARIKSNNSKEDSFIDIAGYAACGGEIASQSLNEENKMDTDTIVETFTSRFPKIATTNSVTASAIGN